MDALQNKKNRVLVILVIIALATILVRFLILSRLDHSALLYLGIPFLIAIALLYFTNQSKANSWTTRYKNHLRDSLIIMLASSALLHEGFLCVLMFMPIYFIVMFLVFIGDYFQRKSNGHFNLFFKAWDRR